jgi:Putative capsular polysaccharide synthesis protein
MGIKKKLKRKISPYYHGLKASFYRGKNIYLIYSMGKVGSASIYTSLKQKKPYSDIFHLHFLSDNYLKNILPKQPEFFHSNIALGNKILRHIKKNKHKRIKVITLVREPVSRSISELFQNWQSSYEDILKIDNQQLVSRIENSNFEFALNWFDNEFLEYTGIDIFSLPFDKHKGYSIYTFDNFDMVCMKLESLNAIGEKAMIEFLGEDFNLLDANMTSQKVTSEKYQYLKDNVKINKEILISLYDSKLVAHFYNQEEIQKFHRRWVREY